VHVDDNSNDGTVDKIIEYLKNKPKLNGRVTLIT
jgi:glycosyltransferase involved in cell wall biosynthesis